MPLTAAIIQARMGSTRLPGKVMMPLAGKTVLAHVLERCQAIEGVEAVCCATTKAAEDTSIVTEARRCGAIVFRGSKSDVLGRYHRAAEMLKADVILRVTSDCPLIDPRVCTAVLSLRGKTDADYATNNMPPSWPHGLDCEAFSGAALARAARFARDPFEREHVTPWLRNTENVNRANLDGPGGDIACQRWTLDYPEDLCFFEALFAHLPPPPALPGMEDVWAVLQRHPEISEINRDRSDAARTQLP